MIDNSIDNSVAQVTKVEKRCLSVSNKLVSIFKAFSWCKIQFDVQCFCVNGG